MNPETGFVQPDRFLQDLMHSSMGHCKNTLACHQGGIVAKPRPNAIHKKLLTLFGSPVSSRLAFLCTFLIDTMLKSGNCGVIRGIGRRFAWFVRKIGVRPADSGRNYLNFVDRSDAGSSD